MEASPGRSLAAYLEDATGGRVVHLAYEPDPDDDRPEGLALLSKHPVRESWACAMHNNHAATFHVELAGATLAITNVHLDWQHAEGRVAAIDAFVEQLIDRHPGDLEILCGDFNDHEDGPVAAYLHAAARPWRDAAGAGAPVTLDFAENPRWRGSGSTERPGRFDRIYVRDGPRVTASGLFARQPANRFGIVPSDHYGVFVDLAW